MQAYHDNWGEWFTGDDKKKNKYGKNNNAGRKEDTELKRLQERLSSLKSARQMYQKYKNIMSDEEAKKKTYNLFPEVTGLNLDDYQKAVHSLLEGFSINTTERKKFQTSIYREVAEWLFDEKDKKEYERKAADFNESMNKLSERWDLYKSLLEKTGSKFFAESAWVDAFQMDDKTKSLMDEYYANYHEIFNLQNSLNMTDGEAKENLKLPNQYEEWKKITELLRGNYVKSLQDAADIIEKTEDYEDKILKIRERYNDLISKTNDPGIKARYEIQRDKEIGKVKLDKFKNSSDYLNFYGAIVSLGMDKAQAIGERIRQNINEALQSGAIDAREYAKEIKQQLQENILNYNFEVQLHSQFGIAYDGSSVASWDDFMKTPCTLKRVSQDANSDLALLQLDRGVTPDGKYIFTIDETNIKVGDKLEINQPLYMIGYNRGVTLAQTTSGISAQFTSGTVTQQPDGNRVMYSIPAMQGSSGSPVVDDHGRVVAVNFAGTNGSDNFNFGIPVLRVATFLK